MLGPLSVALVLLGWFARHVVRAPAPLLSPGTARHPGMRSGAPLVAASFFALLGSRAVMGSVLVDASSHAAPMGVAAAGLAIGAGVAQRVQRRSGVITHA